MRRAGLALALLAIGSQAMAAVDEAPVRLPPVSKWVMDYDENSCALRRVFGDAEGQALLELRAYSPGDAFQVTVASSTISTRNKAPRVRFEPDAELRKVSGILGTFGDMEGVIYSDSFRLQPENQSEDDALPPWPVEERNARETAVSGLAVTDSFERDLLLETGTMHAPMEAMRTCLDDLLTHWGLDAEAHRKLSRPLAPKDYASWVRRVQQHYPQEMLNRLRNGYIHVRLIVGADGIPTSCNVQIEVRDVEFQQVACDTLMRYARFEPALDAGGHAIASYYTTAILYQLYP